MSGRRRRCAPPGQFRCPARRNRFDFGKADGAEAVESSHYYMDHHRQFDDQLPPAARNPAIASRFVRHHLNRPAGWMRPRAAIEKYDLFANRQIQWDREWSEALWGT